MKTLLPGAILAVTGWAIAAVALSGPENEAITALAALLIVIALTAAMFVAGCLAIIAGEISRIRRARRAARPAPGIRGVIEGGRK